MKNEHNIPSIFIILGATGDLAVKKILPSLWHLFQNSHLPTQTSIIGFARTPRSDENFREFVKEAILLRGAEGADKSSLEKFLSYFTYQTGSFDIVSAYQELYEKISKIESSWAVCANKLFYLSVPPTSYEAIFENLAQVKLNIPCGGNEGWSRILVEKPFGLDLETSRSLQSLLSLYFKEEQIYRIDHYLAKEIVQGVENFRFSNNLFEKTWDNTTIDRIDIRLHETIGAEKRGSFYDSVGALRDVGQNHLLMMLASVTMEYSSDMLANIVRASRVNILRALRPWTEALVKNETFRAQYSGFQSIEGVSPHSQTETYFALTTEIESVRWKGVPIMLEAGKRVGTEARKEIVLTLKHSKNCLLCEEGPHAPNRIVFRLEPNDEIIIHFWMKKPGFEKMIEERTFSFFLYEKESKIQYVEEYGKLLYAAMAGDQALFVLNDEVEALWKFTDPIIDSWKKNIVPLASYDPDTIPKSHITDDINCEWCEVNDAKLLVLVLGMVGLGKMGANLSRRLHESGVTIIGYDSFVKNSDDLASELVITKTNSLVEMVSLLPDTPRIIWLMVPASIDGMKPVDEILFGENGLAILLKAGDIIIDGGNSFYKDSIVRAKKLRERGIHFLDVGVSGGPSGARRGPSLMIGGEQEIFKIVEPIFERLALSHGYQFFLGAGAGHFVKMVHNGIEYGMMQSIAEGFDILKQSEYHFDLERVAEVYNHGTVIESHLISWLGEAYREYGVALESISGVASHSGEGTWTVETAHELNVPVSIIEGSLDFRKQTVKNPSYAGKIISALRNRFGGHSVK